MSRQSNSPSVDIRLLESELKSEAPDVPVRVMCRYSKSAAGLDLSYAFYMAFPLMWNIARARVLVLDGFCIPASIFKHRKSLKIVQMWHAMGSFKKFGRCVIGEKEGYSRTLADLMNMHGNYDVILTSSHATAPYFAEAFGYDESSMRIMPLPRTDFIRMDKYRDDCARRIRAAYPDLFDGRKIILYCPTFRKNVTEDDLDNLSLIAGFASAVDTSRYHLVIRPHPIVRLDDNVAGARVVYDFQSIELLSVADFFVTDYSAFILEAALAGKPLFRYVPDRERYMSARGFFVDIDEEWPGFASADASEVFAAIDGGSFDPAEVRAFADKYVEDSGHCTKDIAQLLLELRG
ncbi:MAG: CDP-glycerol glycerophosphotransferase family protein [Eubacterium sp.]|nr:CDP-glycerol glycerophosphotransferase family protein [Eubacterium sp.]